MANRTLSCLSNMLKWAMGRDIIKVSPSTSDGLDLSWQSIVRLLLTGQRRTEVSGMSWSEIDLDARTWTIPTERAKNKCEHVVPLSQQAIAILAGLPHLGEHVFTLNGHSVVTSFSTNKVKLDGCLPGMKPWCFHDIRRSVSTGMAALGNDEGINNRILNHVSGGKEETPMHQTYNRFRYEDKKRAALEIWARHVEVLVNGEPESTMVQLRG